MTKVQIREHMTNTGFGIRQYLFVETGFGHRNKTKKIPIGGSLMYTKHLKIMHKYANWAAAYVFFCF